MYKPNIKNNVPRFVYSNATIEEIYKIQEDELNKVIVQYDDLEKQFFVDTATWSISDYEKFLGIKTDLSKSDNIRKAAIKARLTGVGTMTNATLYRIIDEFGYGEFQILDNFAPNVVKVKFTDTSVSKKFGEIMEVLNDIIPAHILLVALTNTMSWDELEAIKTDFNRLDLYTWNDFITEDVITASGFRTTTLRLLTWLGRDVINKADFNYNFDLIEKSYLKHNHDGKNSTKLNADKIIKEDTTLDIAIKEISDKLPIYIINELNKTLVSENLGVTSCANNITAGKELIAEAITSKGVSTKSTDTFNTFENNLRNIALDLAKSVTATPNHVIKGKTYIDGGYLKTGTLEATSNKIYKADHTKRVYIDNGLSDGTSKILAEPNLIAENIRGGVTVWGVEGTLRDKDLLAGTIDIEKNIVNSTYSFEIISNLTDTSTDGYMYFDKIRQKISFFNIESGLGVVFNSNPDTRVVSYKIIRINVKVENDKYYNYLQVKDESSLLYEFMIEGDGYKQFAGYTLLEYDNLSTNPKELIIANYYKSNSNSTVVNINGKDVKTVGGGNYEPHLMIKFNDVSKRDEHFLVLSETLTRNTIQIYQINDDNSLSFIKNIYANQLTIDDYTGEKVYITADGYGRVFGYYTTRNSNSIRVVAIDEKGGYANLNDCGIEKTPYGMVNQNKAVVYDKERGLIWRLESSTNQDNIYDTLVLLDIDTFGTIASFKYPIGENIKFKQIRVNPFFDEIYLWKTDNIKLIVKFKFENYKAKKVLRWYL